MKSCSKCHSADNGFYADKRASDGLQSQCKSCIRAHQKLHYEANRQERSVQDRARYQRRKAIVTQRMKAYYRANSNDVKARVTAYCSTRKEEISLKRRASRLRRIEHCRQRERRAYVTNSAAYKSRSAARRAGLSGGFTRADVQAIFLSQRGLCIACRQRLANFEIDHIMPLALGGENTRTNLQLLCRSCNREKHCKHPIDFMRRKGYLL